MNLMSFIPDLVIYGSGPFPKDVFGIHLIVLPFAFILIERAHIYRILWLIAALLY